MWPSEDVGSALPPASIDDAVISALRKSAPTLYRRLVLRIVAEELHRDEVFSELEAVNMDALVLGKQYRKSGQRDKYRMLDTIVDELSIDPLLGGRQNTLRENIQRLLSNPFADEHAKGG